MVEYSSASLYIESATSLRDKIDKIDAVLDALLSSVLEAAETDNITEYQLDDGQTKIKAIYKGADAVLRSISALERVRQIYVNGLNGRCFRLVDSRNLRRG